VACFWGAVAEVATVAAIFLTIPLVVVSAKVSAVFWSARFGTTDSSPDSSGVA